MQAPLKKKLEGFATLPGTQLPSGLDTRPKNIGQGMVKHVHRRLYAIINHMQRHALRQ
jgi:hypothetical protein